jgi:putative membrane protein
MTWHWHTEPPVLGIFLSIGLIYYLGVGPLRMRIAPAEPLPRKQMLIFFAGFALLFLALVSPLDELGENFLFSAHMFQHLVLLYFVPPLLLAGIPTWLLEAAIKKSRLLPLLRVITKPVVAVFLSTFIISFWHFPGLYDAALHNKYLHAFEHVTFIFAAILLWWPILSPIKSLPRLPYGPQLLYIFVMSVVQLPLFGIITFAIEPIYPTYDAAPRLTYMDALEDQQLGGALMKTVGMVVMLTRFTYIFFLWFGESEREARRPRLQAQ